MVLPRSDKQHFTRDRNFFQNICTHNWTHSCSSSTAMAEIHDRDLGKMSYKSHRYRKMEKHSGLFQMYLAHSFTRSWKTQVPQRKTYQWAHCSMGMWPQRDSMERSYSVQSSQKSKNNIESKQKKMLERAKTLWPSWKSCESLELRRTCTFLWKNLRWSLFSTS